MKRFIFSVIAVLAMCFSSLFAQVDTTLNLTNEEFFNNSEIIVEGKFIYEPVVEEFGNSCSYDAKGLCKEEDIYTEYKFKVNYVYKGGEAIKQSDTIVIVFDWGAISNKKTIKDQFGREHSDGPYEINKYPKSGRDAMYNIFDQNIIMFLKTSDFPDNPNKNNNYIRTKPLIDRENGRLHIGTLGDMNSWIFPEGASHVEHDLRIKGLNDLIFENRYELYEYMKQFKGLSFPELSDKNTIKVPLTPQQIKAWEENERDLKYMRELQKQFRESDKKKVTNDSKSGNDITFYVINQQKTFNSSLNKHYFEFDIAVSI